LENDAQKRPEEGKELEWPGCATDEAEEIICDESRGAEWFFKRWPMSKRGKEQKTTPTNRPHNPTSNMLLELNIIVDKFARVRTDQKMFPTCSSHHISSTLLRSEYASGWT